MKKRTRAFVLAVGIMLGALVGPGMVSAGVNTTSGEYTLQGDVPLVSSEGPSLTTTTTTVLSNPLLFPTSNTIRLDFVTHGYTLRVSSAAQPDITLLSHTDNSLEMKISNLNSKLMFTLPQYGSVEVSSGITSFVLQPPLGVGDGKADFSYTAANSVTFYVTDLPADTTIRVLDGDGSIVATLSTGNDGAITFTVPGSDTSRTLSMATTDQQAVAAPQKGGGIFGLSSGTIGIIAGLVVGAAYFVYSRRRGGKKTVKWK